MKATNTSSANVASLSVHPRAAAHSMSSPPTSGNVA